MAIFSLFSVVVRVQMLAELEEIITYKQYADQPDRQATIRKTWMKRYILIFTNYLRCHSLIFIKWNIYRLKGCQRNVDVWQQILKVRTLVISPKENMEMWIKFANLCRKSDRLELAEKTLKQLLVGHQKLEVIHPSVIIFR